MTATSPGMDLPSVVSGTSSSASSSSSSSSTHLTALQHNNDLNGSSSWDWCSISFRTLNICTCILHIKVMWTLIRQGQNHTRPPEDGVPVSKHRNPFDFHRHDSFIFGRAYRWDRILMNDLENIPYTLIAAWASHFAAVFHRDQSAPIIPNGMPPYHPTSSHNNAGNLQGLTSSSSSASSVTHGNMNRTVLIPSDFHFQCNSLLISVYTLGRIMHTVCYANKIQPWRSVCFSIGQFSAIGLCFNSLMATLAHL